MATQHTRTKRRKANLRADTIHTRVVRAVDLPTASQAATFPLTLPWYTSYWAEGPEFEALGLAPNADVDHWPDEMVGGFGSANKGGGSDLRKPTYLATDAAFNSKPCIFADGDGAEADYLETAVGSSIGQPFTVAVVGRFTGNSQGMVEGRRGTGSAQGVLYISGAPRFYIFAPDAGDSGIAGDTNVHLFIMQVNGASTTLQVDSTVSSTFNPGANSPTAVAMFITDLSTGVGGDKIAFYGIKSGTLTAPQKAELLAWSQSHYGTP